MLDVVQIKNIYVHITDKDGASLGEFDLVALQTNFTVGAIPTCTATLSIGTALGGTPDDDAIKDTVSKLIQKNGSSNLNLYIEFTLRHIMNEGLGVLSKYTVTVPVFDGVIGSISLGQSASAYGGSQLVIAVTAHHRFCELYRWGTNGMVYATPEAVVPGKNIATLVQQSTADSGADGSTTSTTLASQEIIAEVLQNTCRPPGESSSTKANSPIVEIISKFINRMQDAGALKPEGKVNIGDASTSPNPPYLRGSTAISAKFRQGYFLVKRMLESLWISVNKSSIGSTLLWTLTSPEMFLAFVPNSVDSISVLPYDCITIDVTAPIVTPDMYTALQLSRNINTQPDPSGVIVTASNNVLMYNAQNSAVAGRYPNTQDTASIMWATVQAPGWLVTEDASYEADTKESTASATGIDRDSNCNAYAEWVYRRIIGKNNSCSMVVGLKHIEAFKALGTVCLLPDTMYGDLQGYLNSYSLSYNQTVDKSGITIKLSFTHILTYIKTDIGVNTDKALNRLYTTDTSDYIRFKFPSIGIDKDILDSRSIITPNSGKYIV